MDKVTIIDVIVPCYNVESVIGRCIESLLDQTISNEEYQCFFINDCSTDNTHRVLERYKNTKNITIINQKENLGLAATRNTGIKKGKYQQLKQRTPTDRRGTDNESRASSTGHNGLRSLDGAIGGLRPARNGTGAVLFRCAGGPRPTALPIERGGAPDTCPLYTSDVDHAQ